MGESVAVRRHARITPTRPDDILVAGSIGASGEFVGLWSAPNEGSAPAPGGPLEPMATHPVDGRITVQDSDVAVLAEIGQLPMTTVLVQPMPDDRALVVGTRAKWRPTGPDRNAVLYDANGDVVAEQTFGDGIGHVVATRSGDVWVGYFDEGVYGNYGWGDSPDNEPVGSCGLVRFAADLTPAWRCFPGRTRSATATRSTPPTTRCSPTTTPAFRWSGSPATH